MSYSAFILCAAQTKGQYLSVTPVQVQHLSSPFPTQLCYKSHFSFVKKFISAIFEIYLSCKNQSITFLKTELPACPTVKPNSLMQSGKYCSITQLFGTTLDQQIPNLRNNYVNHLTVKYASVATASDQSSTFV